MLRTVNKENLRVSHLELRATRLIRTPFPEEISLEDFFPHKTVNEEKFMRGNIQIARVPYDHKGCQQNSH